MPKFFIKEKIFSLGDQFKIKDENKKDVYQVIGKVVSFGDQLSFQDMTGKQLFYINEKPINFLKVYEIYKGESANELHFRVKKKLTLFKPKFEIEAPGDAKYVIDGGLWQHDFTISKDGLVVATVSKTFVSLSDYYGVDVIDGEDPAAILSVCISIDQALHDK